MPVFVLGCVRDGDEEERAKGKEPDRLTMKLNRIKGYVEQLSSAREGLE